MDVGRGTRCRIAEHVLHKLFRPLLLYLLIKVYNIIIVVLEIRLSQRGEPLRTNHADTLYRR